jgi:hypothetical protein
MHNLERDLSVSNVKIMQELNLFSRVDGQTAQQWGLTSFGDVL